MGFTTPAPLLHEILALHGKWRAADPAVCADGATWSWREFCGASHRFAHALIAAGIKPGDRVGLLMTNGLPMVQAIFGAIAAGAVVVPLNVSVSDDAAIAMFNDAGVTVVVSTDDLVPRVDGMRARLTTAPLLLAPQPTQSGWRDLAGFCAGQPETLPGIELGDDALINIIYSSGTTGLPKGICHDHRGRRDWAYDLAIALRYNASARSLLTIGLYSNISWVVMLSTLLAGGCIHVHRSFDEQAVMDYIARERITHTAMVPIQFQRLVDAIGRQGGADTSSMQAMMSCGSPLREPLKRSIFKHFECGVIELYGLTEGIITTLEPEHAQGRWASVGRPLIGTDLCIVDDNDKPVSAGCSGEICSRGRIAMPGYWQRPDADLDATLVDADGNTWLRSGDVGYVDEQGYLFIVDRKKDMILSGGQNIYPQDIEAVVATHPAVYDVAVIGLPSERWGETPVALVVFTPGQDEDQAGLKDWVNQRLGRQQRIADVIEVDALPRNPNGKILKRELRDTFKDRRYA